MAEETSTATGTPPEVTKESIRKEIWDYLESNDLVNFPRPISHRIPNFKGAATAGDQAATLDVFKKAQTVKINPDKPQEQCRFLTLEARKTLLVPTPRLRHGLFNQINLPEDPNKEMLRFCSTSQGIKEHSTPISLDSKVKIDLIIIGSVAVSKSGFRIGKGEGFADLEFGMMRAIGAVSEDIVVVTTVHDSQITNIPESLLQPYDLTVDYIVTPTQIIECPRRPKPGGIIWSMLTKEKLRGIPILKKLRHMQREAGVDVTLKDGEETEVSESNPEEQADRPQQRDRRQRRKNIRKRDGDSREDRGDMGRGQQWEQAGGGSEGAEGRPRERRNNRRRRRKSSRKSETESYDTGPESGAEGDKENQVEDSQHQPQRRRRRAGKPRHDDRSGEDHRRNDRGPDGDQRPRERTTRKRTSSSPLLTVFVGSLPRSLRVSEFKAQVRDLGVNPLRVIWHGASCHAFLQFQKKDEADGALDTLKGFEIDGKAVKVEMSRRGEREGLTNATDGALEIKSEPTIKPEVELEQPSG